MIIYNPHNENIIGERLEEANKVLDEIPAKYSFITGSFLYKENYKDIDVFVVSRTKRKIAISNKKVKITIIDFNDLYSLFNHSVSKSCIAKNLLPKKPLKVTVSDYWHVINEAVPTLLNEKNKFHKNVRFLVLYTEYFKSGEVLDTFQLSNKINAFKNYKDVLKYAMTEVPKIIYEHLTTSYRKRFFYTQASYYKNSEYEAQNFLYHLARATARGIVHGQS